MPKKSKPRSYEEVLSRLKGLQFDVHEVPGVAGRVRVSKYGCAAIIGPDPRGRDSRGGVAMFHKPGLVMGDEIAILLDRGFQKFFKTSKLEMAATADRLKAEHRFAEELDEVIGEVSLYNESLGSVSDEYMYDRLKGRDQDAPPKGLAPWELAAGASGGH